MSRRMARKPRLTAVTTVLKTWSRDLYPPSRDKVPASWSLILATAFLAISQVVAIKRVFKKLVLDCK
jgi:hypothetical protein